MSPIDQKIKAELEWLGSEGATELAKRVEQVKENLKLLSAEFARGTISEQEFLTQARSLGNELRASEQALRSVANATETLAGATEKAKGGMAGFGQSALQTGRVVQDFTQGGLGGILNNIEGLSMALGGGPGLAGVMTIVGVAFLVFKPQIEEAIKSLGLFAEEAKTSITNLKDMEEAVKKNEKAIDGLREKTSLNNDQQKELNRLTEESIKLEGQLAAMRELERLKKLPGATPGDDRAKALEEAVKETGGKQTLKDIQDALVKRNGSFGSDADKLNAERLLSNAKGGHVDALDLLDEMFSMGGTTGAGSSLAKNYDDPGGRKAMKAGSDLFDKELKKKEDAAKAEAKAKEDNDRLVDQLNQQGQDNQEAAKREMETQEEKAKREQEAKEKKRETEQKAEAAKFAGNVEKGSTIDEEAAIAASQLQQQGGYANKRGKFVALDEEGQRHVLAEDILKRIKQQYGNVGPVGAQAAQSIAGKAFGQAEQTASTFAALGDNQAQLIATNEALIARLRAAEQNILRLGGMASRQTAKARTRAPSIPGT